jgi:hypothetical protein
MPNRTKMNEDFFYVFDSCVVDASLNSIHGRCKMLGYVEFNSHYGNKSLHEIKMFVWVIAPLAHTNQWLYIPNLKAKEKN